MKEVERALPCCLAGLASEGVLGGPEGALLSLADFGKRASKTRV